MISRRGFLRSIGITACSVLIGESPKIVSAQVDMTSLHLITRPLITTIKVPNEILGDYAAFSAYLQSIWYQVHGLPPVFHQPHS
jgi:hypothetical protein